MIRCIISYIQTLKTLGKSTYPLGRTQAMRYYYMHGEHAY